MAQGWNSNTYQSDHTVSTDMQNIETNFASLKSLFSGTTAPSNAVAGMPWFDTTNKVLKIRNQANSAWLGVMYGNSSNKIWMYSNSATDGWTVDSSITDSILALKGGSAAYNVSGGNTGGTWSQGTHLHTIAHTHTMTHNHQWSYSYYNAGNYYNYTYNSGGTAVTIPTRTYNNTCIGISTVDPEVGTSTGVNNSYTSNHSDSTSAASTGNSGSSGTASTWRPTAAVGTMQYPTT